MQYPTITLGGEKSASENWTYESLARQQLAACVSAAGGRAAALPWGRNCSKVVSRELLLLAKNCDCGR